MIDDDAYVPASGRRPLRIENDFADRSREMIDAGARHDDRISTAVSLFRDAQEFAPLILPEFDVKMLALDL